MRRSLVVAMARNRVIGRGNALPWKLPADLQFFKRVTMGLPVVMGRRTHESIGRPLPGRLNVVVSRNPAYQAPGCIVVGSLADAWRAVDGAPEAFVIGGSAIFAEALATADRIYLTEVDAEVPGDTYFPEFDRRGWTERELARQAADERHAYALRILQLDRAPAP